MGPRPPSPPQPTPLLSFPSPCGGRKQTGACSFSADGDEDEAVEDDDGNESKEDEPSPFDVRSLPSDDLPDVNNHFSDRKLSMLYSAEPNKKPGQHQLLMKGWEKKSLKSAQSLILSNGSVKVDEEIISKKTHSKDHQYNLNRSSKMEHVDLENTSKVLSLSLEVPTII
ncbi:uncharacterized protein LOC135617933 isoform X1 [Musa acuminata AAA Group]|uniref:uncharacterized protein LOC135617933 isoform X1 n=1 Tax=Musa acuminata AAA Group TaxID=214697 RepID=UPI0031DAEA0B